MITCLLKKNSKQEIIMILIITPIKYSGKEEKLNASAEVLHSIQVWVKFRSVRVGRIHQTMTIPPENQRG